MEEYRVEVKDFNLKHIFECGQCFRWNMEEDLSYTGVIKYGVINVKIEEGYAVFCGNVSGSLKEIVDKYFDLGTDYSILKDRLSKVDSYMKESIDFGYGIRILNQDLWEMIISYIISANNNIPRIKKIIETMSKKYGKEIKFRGKSYYLFPRVEELSKVSMSDLRALGVGFRDKRIYATTQMIANGDISLSELEKELDEEKLKEKLCLMPGVGDKVASCIMLFGMHRFNIFPVDVWVRRVMNDLYIKSKDETSLKKEEIQKIASEKFGNIQGLAQQYLFYWRREKDES